MRIWARGRYTLSVQYAQVIIAYASFQAIWDHARGTKLSWKPSGGGVKAHKNHRYRHMRLLAWVWTITHTSLLISACVYRIGKGIGWYNIIPALVIEAFDLLWLHRFLLYRHPQS